MFVIEYHPGFQRTRKVNFFKPVRHRSGRYGPVSCLLHSRWSDAPICLRCSQRQVGTKPSDVASGPHSHWPNGAQCVHLHRLVPGSHTILYDSLVGTVKESYLLQLPLKDSCIVHVWLPIGRWRRAILNTIGASDRLMWSGHHIK